MRFSKIKWNGKKATMEWTVTNGEDREERALRNCPDGPAQAFKDAMEALAAFIPRMIGARKDYADNGLTVTGVTLSQDDKDRRGFIFHCRKDVPSTGAAFNFNTPLIHEAEADAPNAETGLQEDAMGVIERLLIEAKGYVEGNRDGHQEEMSLGQGGGSAMAVEDDEEDDEEEEAQEGGFRVGEVPDEKPAPVQEEDLEGAAENMEAEARRAQMAVH